MLSKKGIPIAPFGESAEMGQIIRRKPAASYESDPPVVLRAERPVRRGPYNVSQLQNLIAMQHVTAENLV
jgi:hypothetical protein